MHLMLLAYPGYTVQSIQEELSWREVEELTAQWDKTPPTFLEAKRLRMMAQKHWHMKLTSTARPAGGDDLVGQLVSAGLM